MNRKDHIKVIFKKGIENPVFNLVCFLIPFLIAVDFLSINSNKLNSDVDFFFMIFTKFLRTTVLPLIIWFILVFFHYWFYTSTYISINTSGSIIDIYNGRKIKRCGQVNNIYPINSNSKYILNLEIIRGERCKEEIEINILVEDYIILSLFSGIINQVFTKTQGGYKLELKSSVDQPTVQLKLSTGIKQNSKTILFVYQAKKNSSKGKLIAEIALSIQS